MKKVIIIALTFAFIIGSLVFLSFWQTKTTMAESLSGYAQVVYNNVYLYRYPSETQEYYNRYFLLEPTYFVKLIEKTNDYFYKVEYLDLQGYVKISDVELVSETPKMPYPENITFDIYNKSNAILRSEPTTENNNNSILKILNSSTKNLTFYGKISGEESLLGCGNIWYYCKHTNIDGQSTYGYIYSSLTSNLSPILQNEEVVSTVNANTISITDLLYLNLSTQNITLLILSLPCLVIVYLFVKPTKILKKFE